MSYVRVRPRHSCASNRSDVSAAVMESIAVIKLNLEAAKRAYNLSHGNAGVWWCEDSTRWSGLEV